MADQPLAGTGQPPVVTPPAPGPFVPPEPQPVTEAPPAGTVTPETTIPPAATEETETGDNTGGGVPPIPGV